MLIKKTRMHVIWPFQISSCAESNYKPNMQDHLNYCVPRKCTKEIKQANTN